MIQEFPIGDWELIDLNEFSENQAKITSTNKIEEIDQKPSPSKLSDVVTSKKSNDTDFQEFAFDKVEKKFSVKSSTNESSGEMVKEVNDNDSDNGSDENSEGEGLHEHTVVLKTKNFKRADKTQVVNAKEVLGDVQKSVEEADSSNRNSDDIEHDEKEGNLPVVGVEDKTIIFNRNDSELKGVLTEAKEASDQFKNEILEEKRASLEEELDENQASGNEELDAISAEDNSEAQRKKIILVALLGLAFYFFYPVEKKDE